MSKFLIAFALLGMSAANAADITLSAGTSTILKPDVEVRVICQASSAPQCLIRANPDQTGKIYYDLYVRTASGHTIPLDGYNGYFQIEQIMSAAAELVKAGKCSGFEIED